MYADIPVPVILVPAGEEGESEGLPTLLKEEKKEDHKEEKKENYDDERI